MTGADNPASGPLSGAGERIRQMLVTAETVAQDIRREATEEAERYLAERRREADALVAAQRRGFEEALEVLRREGPELQRRLAAVTAALEHAVAEPQTAAPAADAAAPAPPPAAAEPASEPAVAGPEAAPQEDAGAAPASSHVRQRALIRATQLAVQGADRATVRETIQREFELDNPEAIVNEILGDG